MKIKIENEEQEEIVQILPADGWYVVFCFDGLNVTRFRLVCWALVRRTVDGAEFTGYIHESQFNT